MTNAMHKEISKADLATGTRIVCNDHPEWGIFSISSAVSGDPENGGGYFTATRCARGDSRIVSVYEALRFWSLA